MGYQYPNLSVGEQARLDDIVRDYSPGRTRANDYETSKAGAEAVSFRAGSQKEKLMRAFFEAYTTYDGALTQFGQPALYGLTDEQAAVNAGLSLRSCFWKRCSELRDAGLIRFNGETMIGTQGSPCNISEITQAGLDLARDYNW